MVSVARSVCKSCWWGWAEHVRARAKGSGLRTSARASPHRLNPRAQAVKHAEMDRSPIAAARHCFIWLPHGARTFRHTKLAVKSTLKIGVRSAKFVTKEPSDRCLETLIAVLYSEVFLCRKHESSRKEILCFKEKPLFIYQILNKPIILFDFNNHFWRKTYTSFASFNSSFCSENNKLIFCAQKHTMHMTRYFSNRS